MSEVFNVKSADAINGGIFITFTDEATFFNVAERLNRPVFRTKKGNYCFSEYNTYYEFKPPK